jgi:hypothetical protein
MNDHSWGLKKTTADGESVKGGEEKEEEKQTA